jgi:hypothetical protein
MELPRYFLGFKVWSGVVCLGCGKTVNGRTLYKAIEKWNRRAGESGENRSN